MQGLASVPLGKRFSDADDRFKAGPDGRNNLGGDLTVGFTESRPTLRMTQYDVPGACVRQHRGGDLSGEGSAGLLVAILPADRNAAAQRLRHLRDQGRRRTNDDLRVRRMIDQGSGYASSLFEVLGEAVHFPVSDDQHL
jgi:hypothetical protein